MRCLPISRYWLRTAPAIRPLRKALNVTVFLTRHTRSYRNLDGYFDPVFVTIWRRGQVYRAEIIDPVRELELLSIQADSEIFISVSSDNHIQLTHAATTSSELVEIQDRVVIWPSP